MHALITGATGFVGSALCRRLCLEGHIVSAFHRPTSYTGGIADLPLITLTGDLTNSESVERAVEAFRPDVIFHLGAQMTAAPTVNRIMQVNVLGTRAVLQAAMKYGVRRVVLMSSACTLGMPELFRNHDRAPVIINEARVQNAGMPLWPFAESKYLAEMEAQSAAAKGLDTVIVNPFMVIGPGDWYRRKRSLLMQLKQHAPMLMVRGGINVISLSDTVTGLINASVYGKSGERYLLCGENITFMEFCRLCSRAGGFEEPKLLFDNELLAGLMSHTRSGRELRLECLDESVYRCADRYFYYNPKKSRVVLHLSRQENIADTIDNTYRWFEENA